MTHSADVGEIISFMHTISRVAQLRVIMQRPPILMSPQVAALWPIKRNNPAQSGNITYFPVTPQAVKPVIAKCLLVSLVNVL
jgi:hypothetical protein